LVRDLRARHGPGKKVLRVCLSAEIREAEKPGVEIWAFPMLMDKAGTSGALVRMEGFPSGGNSTLVYFGCTDYSVEAARVVESGGRMQREKMSIGQYGSIALAYDTEGNMFGLHSMQ
jgi:uncharacterized protein